MKEHVQRHWASTRSCPKSSLPHPWEERDALRSLVRRLRDEMYALVHRAAGELLRHKMQNQLPGNRSKDPCLREQGWVQMGNWQPLWWWAP